MAEMLGRNACIKLGAVTIARMRSWTLTVNGEQLDTSEFATLWAESITGMMSWSASIEGMTDLLEASQDALRLASLTGAELTTLRFYLNGAKYYTGNCYISSYVENVDHKGIVSFTMNVQGNGAISYV